ncbi:hypothetical protein BsWGS_23335 [Bradybaena similaris]
MENSSKEEYEKFLNFCSVSLKGENPKFLDLIKSRYAACDDVFRCSGEMVKLLEKTQKNMADEESRKFVHLKDFLTKLKIHTAAKWKKKKKRKHSSDSESDSTHSAKVPKLKDCAVVVTKFPNDDAALCLKDEVGNTMDTGNDIEFNLKKTCSIADGDVSNAFSIIIADDQQVNMLREELGSAIDSESPIPLSQFPEPSFARRIDRFGREENSTSGSCSSSPHIPFSTKGRSSRKHVVYADDDDDDDDDDFEDHIVAESTDFNDNDNYVASASLVAQEPDKSQVESDQNPDIQTSPKESIMNSPSISPTKEPSKKKSIAIIDVNFSNSPDVLVILPSPSYQTTKEFSDTKSIKNKTPQKDDAQCALTMCSEMDDFQNVDIISNDTISPTSVPENKENTSNTSNEVPAKTPFHDSVEQAASHDSVEQAPSPSLITTIDLTETASNQDAVTIDPQHCRSDVEKDSLPCEETIHEDGKAVQNQDILVSEAKSSVDTLIERVPLMNDTKDITSSSGSHGIKASIQDAVTIDPQHCSSDVEKDSLPCEETIHEDGNAVQNQDILVSEAKSSVDTLIKRVPLINVTKDITSNSGSHGTKAFSSSFGKQEKTAQKPSSSTETKVVPPLVEERLPEPGDSADEFQKADILDKNQLKQKRRVAKLEHLLESLRDEIEKCQDAEMTLEELDDDNAAYIFEDKLKRKFVAVWNKLCEVTERTVTTGRPTEKRVRFSGTRYQEINRRIEKFLNKKKEFPDFQDIKSIVKLTNKKCNLNLSSMVLNDISREAFVDIGEMLQTRRHQDFIATFGTRQTDVLRGSVDPYLTDSEFRRKVDSNRQVAKSNLDNVIAKYTKLQQERFYGEDREESGEESDQEDDEINSKTEKNNPEKHDENRSEECREVVEDVVTTESIEVDIAEEEDEDDDLNHSSSGTYNTAEQPVSKYNPSMLSLGRSTYLLSPDKGKPIGSRSSGVDAVKSGVFSEALNTNSNADRGPELAALGGKDDDLNSNTDSIIVIDESPAKGQQEAWKASPFKARVNPCSLTTQSNIQDAESEFENGKPNSEKAFTAAPRRPNIKYTAKKPLHAERAAGLNAFGGGSEDLGKFKISSNCEIDEDEDEDQSSDSASEQDADDKFVDDDVDEIVMIINRSESECDTVSSRDPSPISVVSLSSESLDDISSSWEKEGSPAVESPASLPTYAVDEIIPSPKASKKYSHMQKDDTLEKCQFMEAMGIRKNEKDASASSDLTGEMSHEKNKDIPLFKTIETGEMTKASQKHIMPMADVEDKSIGQQQKQPIAVESVLAINKRTSPVNRFSQDSDDCIIIPDTPTEIVEAKVVNQVTTAGEDPDSVKKTLDFQVLIEESCDTDNDEVILADLPTNKKPSGSCTEVDRELNVHGKGVSDTGKKTGSEETLVNTEMFDPETMETTLPQATAEQNGSGKAEKLQSLFSLLQKISGSTTDSFMLQDNSTESTSNGDILEESQDDQMETTGVSVSESICAHGKGTSPGKEDTNMLEVVGDMMTDPSQTNIRITGVCSIVPESCHTSSVRNFDAPLGSNACEYSNKTTSSDSDVVQKQSAARNGGAVISLESEVSDSCCQDISNHSPSSSRVAQPDLPLMKSTDDKYSSSTTTVITGKSSSLFQTSESDSLTIEDSQDSCIEIIEETPEDAQEASDSNFRPSPEPCLTLKPANDSSLKDKATGTAANHSAIKDTKVWQNVSDKRNLVCPPSIDNCFPIISGVNITSTMKENLIVKEPDDTIVIDLCESNSISVIFTEHTGTEEMAAISKQEVNATIDNMLEKLAVEDTAGDSILQTEIAIVETPKQTECGNTKVETPEQIECGNTKVKTPEQAESGNTKVETPKHAECSNTKVETQEHSECGNTKVETPKHAERGNTKVETSEHSECGNTKVETPEQAEHGNTKVETPKHDEHGNTKVETPKNDNCENMNIKTHKVEHNNTNKHSNKSESQDSLSHLERTELSFVGQQKQGDTFSESAENCDNVQTDRAVNTQGNSHTDIVVIDVDDSDSYGSSGVNVGTNSGGNYAGNVDNNGIDWENVNTDRIRNIGDNHTDAVDKGKSSIYCDDGSEEHFDSNNGNNEKNVYSNGDDKENAHADNLENVHSIGNEKENVYNDEKSVRTESVGNNESNAHSNSNECDKENVNSNSNDGEHVHSVRNKDIVSAGSIGNREVSAYADIVGNKEESVHIDNTKNNDGDGHIGRVESEENFQAECLGGKGEGVLIDSAGVNEGNVEADGVGNVGENGKADDIGNVQTHFLASSVENGENIQADVQNNAGSVEADDVETNVTNVQTDDVANNGENVQANVQNNVDNVQAHYVESNVTNVQADGAANNGENVQANVQNNVDNVQAHYVESNVTNVQADGAANNGENVQANVQNNVDNVQAHYVESNVTNVQADGAANNGENVQANVQNNVDNVQAHYVESNVTNVQADGAANNGENVQANVQNNADNVQADYVENNVTNVQADGAANNGENDQVDGAENNVQNVVADGVGNIEENVQANSVGSCEENILVNSVGNKGDDTIKIDDYNRVMDSSDENKSNKPCDNVIENESYNNDNIGALHNLNVRAAHSEDKCMGNKIVQIVENEQNRIDQKDIIQRSDNDSNNKTKNNLEVEDENDDDDGDSVDLLSTDSDGGEKCVSKQKDLDANSGTGHILGQKDLDTSSGGGHTLGQEDLDAYSRDIRTEGQETLESNRGSEHVLELKDLEGNSRDGNKEESNLIANIENGHALGQKDLNADSGNEHISKQSDFDADSRGGNTSKQSDLDANSRGENTSKRSDLNANSEDGHTSEESDLGAISEGKQSSKQSDLNTSSGDGCTGQKDLILDNKCEHEDNTSDDLQTSLIVLDYQSVRSLDAASAQEEEGSRDSLESDTVTESTANVTEKLPESTLSNKMNDSGSVRAQDGRLEGADVGCDEEEATVADIEDDADDVNSSELVTLGECKDKGDGTKNEEKSEPAAKDIAKDDSNKDAEPSSPGDDSKHKEPSSLDDEDEVKIIEELSSAQGVRHSDNSKEDDRRLVDQLLSGIEFGKTKEDKLPSDASADKPLANESGKCSDESVIVETENSSHKPGDSSEKPLPEKVSTPPITNSLCHSSVLSVECEEVDDGELSPSSVCSQEPDTIEIQPTVKSRKRPYNDTTLGLQSEKGEQSSEEINAVSSNPASSSVIDVESLPMFKKPKGVDHDLINEIISSVLAEFPPGGSASKFPLFKAKPPQPKPSNTTDIPEVVIGVDDDDDDVVIMEESSPGTAQRSIFPVALHPSRRRSASFKQQSSGTAPFGRGTLSPAGQSPLKKPPGMHTYGNPSNVAQNVPSTSFQYQSQIPPSNGRRFSFATKNRSPAFMRSRNSLPSTMISNQNRESQSLPRLSPRVPIPSIQSDRASELTRTSPKPFPGTSANFVNRRFQSSMSGHIRSPTLGQIRSPTVGQFRSPTVGQVRSPAPGHSGLTFRPYLPNMSMNRKRNFNMSSMVTSPSNTLATGVAQRGSGRSASHPRQPPFGMLHNTERQQSTQNPAARQRFQTHQFQQGPNAFSSRPTQQRAANRVEIILGDSDDEGEFNNAQSAGPRIVSVSSLSASAVSDTSPGAPVPSGRPGGPSPKQNRDVIVIPD